MLALLLTGATWLGGSFGLPGALGVIVFYLGYLTFLAREDLPAPESGLMTLPDSGESRPLRPSGKPRRMPVRDVLSRSAHWQRAAAFGFLSTAFSALWFWGFLAMAKDPPVQALLDAVWTHLAGTGANAAVAVALFKRRSRE